MILIQGKGVSAGVEHGPIYFYHRTDAAVVKRPAQDLEQEKRRLAEAQEKTKAQLEVLAKKCRRGGGAKSAGRVVAHARVVVDGD